jgi:hypothetical protein
LYGNDRDKDKANHRITRGGFVVKDVFEDAPKVRPDIESVFLAPPIVAAPLDQTRRNPRLIAAIKIVVDYPAVFVATPHTYHLDLLIAPLEVFVDKDTAPALK